jgi:hypothetical protein
MPLSGHLSVIDAREMIIDVVRQHKQDEVFLRQLLSTDTRMARLCSRRNFAPEDTPPGLDSTIELIDTKLLISPTPFREECLRQHERVIGCC